MKYLLIIAIVLALVWLTRAARGREKPPAAPQRAQPPDAHEEMIACAHCGIHLPRSEATAGAGALYCGEPHRLAHEGTPPPGRA